MIRGPHGRIMALKLSKSITATENSVFDSPESRYSPLVTIQNGANGTTPLFCIPGAGASVAIFYALSLALPVSTPMYGLQARGLDSAIEPHADITSAASAYVKAVRTVQPEGPYRLLGHSFGGWIAFEMALQLTAQGQVVADVTIVDSSVPDGIDAPDKSINRVQTLLHLVALYDMQLDTPLALAERDFIGLGIDEQIGFLHAALCKAGVYHLRTPVEVLLGVVRVFEANLATRYTPRTSYAGKVCLVSAHEASDETPEQRLEGWRYYADDVEHLEMPGNHMTMLTSPRVDLLGKVLAQFDPKTNVAKALKDPELRHPVGELI